MLVVAAALLPVVGGGREAPEARQAGSSRLDELGAAEWREDLDFLAEHMPKRHVNLFHTMSRDQFASALAALRARVGALSGLQALMGVAHIVAMVGDGHTRITNFVVPLRKYPLLLYHFSDGVFVQAAPREHGDAVGAKLLAIEERSIDEVHRLVREITPRDSDVGLEDWDRLPKRLVTPEVLYGLGLLEDMRSARYRSERDGRVWTVELAPVDESTLPVCRGVLQPEAEGWIDQMELSNVERPLWLRDPCSRSWRETPARS